MPVPKRLLFLNRCFYPDVEATGQLLTELCEELEDDFEIHVICGNPLYRKAQNKGLVNKAQYGKITIWRINNTTLPKKYFLARFINLFSYYILCFIWSFFLKRMDCVIAETDPPLLASIAYVYSHLRHSGFIYYSQDIWPDVGIVNERMTNPVLTKILGVTNGFLYDKSTQIVVPGRDMKKRLEEKNHIPPYRIEVVENWADPSKVIPILREDNTFIKKYSLENKFVVMYSGNLGLSQDLENIINLADRLKEYIDVIFVLVGNGALKEKLINMSAALNLKNIEFLPYQDKKDLRFSLSSAHIHLIPLKKGMKGIIVPSKVYGIMASGKPFIAAVDDNSEIDRIVKEFRCGIVVKPSDVEELEKAVLWAYRNQAEIKTMGEKGRKALETHYTKEICTKKFKKIVKNFTHPK